MAFLTGADGGVVTIASQHCKASMRKLMWSRAELSRHGDVSNWQLQKLN